MSFKIGDKVVFVPLAETYFLQFSFSIVHLKNDIIYTVRGFDGHGSNGLYLENVYNKHYYGCELSYASSKFRKIQNFGEEVIEKIYSEIEQGSLI